MSDQNIPGWISAILALVTIATKVTIWIVRRKNVMPRPTINSTRRPWDALWFGALAASCGLAIGGMFIEPSFSDRKFAAAAAFAGGLMGCFAVLALLAWGRGED